MKSFTMVAGLLLAAWLAAPALSADKEKGQGQSNNVYRTSTLIGMEAKNKDGADLGTIEDLVIDLKPGQLRYAALSFGGFLGIGDKFFAIPWHSLTLATTDGEKHFVLPVAKEKLEKAPGFNKDDWPDVADKSWQESIDVYYGDKQDKAERRREEGAPYRTVYRASDLTGVEVVNRGGKDLGNIDELVIELESGKIRYAALSFGGFLGFGDKLVAMPWNALTLKDDQEGMRFILNVSEEELRKAEGFDKDHWPNTADPKWQESVDTRYRTARSPAR